MNDNEIIALFRARDPQGIAEAKSCYGNYCGRIARNILRSPEDQEECMNDTWYRAWETIPPAEPKSLGAFLGTITRNLALNRLRQAQARKRGGGTVQMAIEELAECIPAGGDAQNALECRELGRYINGFLKKLPEEKRVAFVLRYYYGEPLEAICKRLGSSQSRVKSMLHRTRVQLKHFLEQEGVL